MSLPAQPACHRPYRKRGIIARWLAACLCAALLAGCQSAPPAGLNAAQVSVLINEGFKQTDQGWEFGLSEKVLFDLNTAEVKDASRASIERLARNLLSVGIDRMRLDGHTDNTGAAEYNRMLSLRRAQAVANILVAAGMPAANVQVRGLGDTHPVADNGTAAGRSENRRVTMVLAV
jgi:outer membrane protein OmpA-like peptidoglycan-associated protein